MKEASPKRSSRQNYRIGDIGVTDRESRGKFMEVAPV